jgi:tRNA U34 5-methylaminomethyl-2-thiouridine-forming methyltransferase MnmC
MKLKNHKEVKTEDGTITVYSKVYNENAHSLHGATNETQLHYIKGCDIIKRSNEHSPFNILEIGFGAGIGFLETFKHLKDKPAYMCSLEIDSELIEYFCEKNNFNFQQINQTDYRFTYKDFILDVLIGDARNRIKDIKKTFHAIYQDAYSPRRNPRLWTIEWFNALKKLCHDDIILSTYSASSSIRKSLLAAGFKIYAGEKFGQKRTSTRAKLNGCSDPAILDHLNRSPALALSDKDCDAYMKRD